MRQTRPEGRAKAAGNIGLFADRGGAERIARAADIENAHIDRCDEALVRETLNLAQGLRAFVGFDRQRRGAADAREPFGVVRRRRLLDEFDRRFQQIGSDLQDLLACLLGGFQDRRTC